MSDEREVTMALRDIEGIGQQAVDVLEAAEFKTIKQLRCFDDGGYRRIWSAIEAREERERDAYPRSYWRRLMTRCIDIIYRVRSSEAADFVPVQYMCPITLDWFQDPVIVASGASYSRHAIEEHLVDSHLDPLTRKDLTGHPAYDNIALRDAVEHYRLHQQRFRIII